MKGPVKHFEPAHATVKGRPSSRAFINLSVAKQYDMEERGLRRRDETLHWRSVVMHGSQEMHVVEVVGVIGLTAFRAKDFVLAVTRTADDQCFWICIVNAGARHKRLFEAEGTRSAFATCANGYAH